MFCSRTDLSHAKIWEVVRIRLHSIPVAVSHGLKTDLNIRRFKISEATSASATCVLEQIQKGHAEQRGDGESSDEFAPKKCSGELSTELSWKRRADVALGGL